MGAVGLGKDDETRLGHGGPRLFFCTTQCTANSSSLLATFPDLVPIIDVGGGASTLVDDLLQKGHENLTVLDLSTAAIQVWASPGGRSRMAR